MFPSASTKLQLNDFKKLKILGRGNFSQVYLAEYKRKEKYAMKEIKRKELGQELYALCLNEIKILQLIKSPNVIKYIGNVVTHDRLYICLEYMDGMDLDQRIHMFTKAGRIMSERSIWYILHQICHGLKDMHKLKILHQDLKPANIFISSACRVKIGDFGLSSILGSSFKLQQYVAGTLFYASPEKINEQKYGLESDVWSVGCIAYEMCTLVSPFCGQKSNIYALKKKISEVFYPPLPMNIYSRQLLFFIDSCLSKKPKDRPTADMAHQASFIMHQKFEQMLVENMISSKSKIKSASVC